MVYMLVEVSRVTMRSEFLKDGTSRSKSIPRFVTTYWNTVHPQLKFIRQYSVLLAEDKNPFGRGVKAEHTELAPYKETEKTKTMDEVTIFNNQIPTRFLANNTRTSTWKTISTQAKLQSSDNNKNGLPMMGKTCLPCKSVGEEASIFTS